MIRTRVGRINEKCSDAITHIQKEVIEGAGINISFVEASGILGEKYFKGHLATIPFDEIKRRFRRNGRRMAGCI